MKEKTKDEEEEEEEEEGERKTGWERQREGLYPLDLLL